MKTIRDEINYLLWSPQEKKQYFQNLYDIRNNVDKIINRLSIQQKLQLYHQLYKEQLCLYEQKDVSKYCQFPFDESYSEEALVKLMQWEIDVRSSFDVSKWELDPDRLNGIDIGPCPIISKSGMWYYFNTFDDEVNQFSDEFLSFMGDSYNFSEEKIERLVQWHASPQRDKLLKERLGFSVSVHKVSNKPDGGYYTDDEDGIMSALARGDGDLLGL